MNSLLNNAVIPKEDPSFDILGGLSQLYLNKARHLERAYNFNTFYQIPECSESEMLMKPTLLLLGAYSTGKTSFIRRLLGRDYIDIHIGPEPTTDRFNALIHGREEIVVNGTVATAIPHLPFSSLGDFGPGLVNKLSVTTVDAPILQHMNIIDTPGVLAGEKQGIMRGYSFSKVARWFAQRSDIILVFFDCSKTDVSDELKGIIQQLQDFHIRVRCILNKVDMLSSKELVRVYGALMWSIGRIITNAEVTRVYWASNNSDSTLEDAGDSHFINSSLREDQEALDKVVLNIHKTSLPRKVGDFFKRMRMLRTHMLLIRHLQKRSALFPWSKETRKIALIEQLPQIIDHLSQKHDIPSSDFPPVSFLRSALMVKKWEETSVDKAHIEIVTGIIVHDIHEISERLVLAIDADINVSVEAVGKPSSSSPAGGGGGGGGGGGDQQAPPKKPTKKVKA
jgi:GTPase SAR1 family protein